MKKENELKVFISRRESKCEECKENLGTKAWIFLDSQKGALCLVCADLDHLDYLHRGNTALTLRAKKYSRIYAVVLKWSRARKRYERQGILVEKEAIEKAEIESLNDAEIREQRRIREQEKREAQDVEYKRKFAWEIKKLFPGIPDNREEIIAEHACKKYSGRVGRSAAAKALDEQAINSAVIAHIRHTLTEYDELLLRGFDRYEARSTVALKIESILNEWKLISSWEND